MGFQAEAKRYLKEGRVRELLFSGTTYQIEVVDEKSGESIWPFFQFDEKGLLKDAFCSCAEEGEECVHLAAGKLKIYGGFSNPLHLRFQNSLWNCLAKLLADHIGYETSVLQKTGEGSYCVDDGVGFTIRAKTEKTKKELQRLIALKPVETPETSIKFSALSQEEIRHWKEGRASPALRYELSFWADLAKWWMRLQEEKIPYTISFVDSSEGFLTAICIKWKGLELSFEVDEADLPQVIPTLCFVDSPLKVHTVEEEGIQEITYDPQKHSFHILHGKKNQKLQGKAIGEWLYVAGDGFYPLDGKSPFAANEIPSSKVGALLTHHALEVKKYLKEVKIHEKPIKLSYSIKFDKEWNLHLVAYLFEKGDLQKRGAALFDGWAFVEKEGFSPVEGALIEQTEKVISPVELSHFIHTHRVWLNTQEGFHTHLASIETHLTYHLSSEGDLRFCSKLHGREGGEQTQDFGDWIYVEREGFFSKKYTRLGGGVRPGRIIPHAEVGKFIKKHHEELENIPGFFQPLSALKRRGLKIEVISETSIKITPEHEPKNAPVQYFGDFVFTEGEGFCELPAVMRLPDKYQKKATIYREELTSFVEEELESLQVYITTLDARLKRPSKFDLALHYLARTATGGVKARLSYATDIGRVAITKIAEAIEQKQRYFFSSGGLLELNADIYKWIAELHGTMNPLVETIELSTMDFLRLETTHEILLPQENDPASELTRTLVKELREFIVREPIDLKGLKSELRNYQQTGLSWLWFLYRNGLAGLLCDDMGLGKTHQAMALMAGVVNQKEKKGARFLVVCPTSVIYHWEDKLELYFPSLKVHTFHGLKRTLKRTPKEGVILTSYGILRMEKEALKKISFEVAIFDEIQIAKNPQSRVHDALLLMQAKMKLGLTGTPIENNLRELKSLFDVVLPGYMPREKRFRDLFSNPIEKQGDEGKRLLLSQMIRPFTLRRKKQEVLSELPEKCENKSYCGLSAQQISLYKQTLEQSREAILSELRDSDAPVPYIHIFSILSNLKQICDHPALVAKDPKNYKEYQSGKWDLFVELLDEAQESGQKVVVFSQYLYMLDIFEYYLKSRGWKYAQIRGDTIDRREQLKSFQEDPECKVFIGSLLAAGLGIDLTAASVVILYDRWWNAARENQAIDRVHRIGQKWGVQVFKLISKNTIEEKIDRLIMKKGRLMEKVVTTDDQAQLKKFSRSDLIDLLSYQDDTE